MTKIQILLIQSADGRSQGQDREWDEVLGASMTAGEAGHGRSGNDTQPQPRVQIASLVC